MFGLFVVSVIGFTILAGLVVALMLADVAFATPHHHATAGGPRQGGSRADFQMRDWARGMAEGVARSFSPKLQTPNAVRELAMKVFSATTDVVRRVRGGTQTAGALEDELQDSRCPSCSREMIGATAPELFAIAGQLSNMDPVVVAQIRRRAAQNAHRVKSLSASNYRQADLVCPLIDAQGCCLAPDVRPVQCRTWWHDKASTSAAEPHMPSADGRAVGDAVEEGLERGLSAAGLDGTRYELNSGLAAVLDNPDAAERWSHGEPVLAGCKTYG